MKFFQFVIVGLLLAVLSSCDTKRVFDEYQPIFEEIWHKDSLVVFDIPVTDTTENYNLYINVRNDINYAYSNLWLFVNIQQPSGAALKDTFEMVLANPTGKWLGEGFGGYKTRQSIYRRNVFFPNSGDYQISIQQGMRDTKLDGISDIGFRVETTK
jgi:gliding motility-associated lipoprotein GldH